MMSGASRRSGKRQNNLTNVNSIINNSGGEDLHTSKGTASTMTTNSWSLGSLSLGGPETDHDDDDHNNNNNNKNNNDCQMQQKQPARSSRRPASLRSIRYLDDSEMSAAASTSGAMSAPNKTRTKKSTTRDDSCGGSGPPFTVVHSHISPNVRGYIEGGIRDHSAQARSSRSKSRSKSPSKSRTPRAGKLSSLRSNGDDSQSTKFSSDASNDFAASSKGSTGIRSSSNSSGRVSYRGHRRQLGERSGSCPDLVNMKLDPQDVISFLKQYESVSTKSKADNGESTLSSPTSVQGFPGKLSSSSSSSLSSSRKSKKVVQRSELQSLIEQTSKSVLSSVGTTTDSKSTSRYIQDDDEEEDDGLPSLSDHTRLTVGTETTDAAIYGTRANNKPSSSSSHQRRGRRPSDRSSSERWSSQPDDSQDIRRDISNRSSEARRTKTHQKIQKFDGTVYDEKTSPGSSCDRRARSRSRPKRKETKKRPSSSSPLRRSSSPAKGLLSTKDLYGEDTESTVRFPPPSPPPLADDSFRTPSSERRGHRSPSERRRNSKPSSFSSKKNHNDDGTKKRAPSLDRSSESVFNPMFFTSTTHHRRMNPSRPSLTWTREKEDNFSDWVILVVSGWTDNDTAQTYHVHRSVVGLGTRASQKLANDFEEYSVNTSSSKNVTVINLKPDAASVFDVLLDYLYGKPLVISTPTATALRHLSDIMGVDTMFSEVNEFIRRDMSGKVTAEMYLRDAEVFNDTHLIEATQRILQI